MFRRKVVIAAFLIVALLPVFLGGSQEELAQEQVLRLAFDAADLKTLDPHFAASTNDRGIVQMIFDGLVRYKPGDINAANIEPDLAVAIPEPEIVNGKQIWTFQLRQGVMCHPWGGNPGYELTAEDVVYSLQKAADPARSAYAGEYTGMTFEATGRYTVKITVEKPLSKLLFLPKFANYAGGFIVCKKAVEDLGDEAFKTNPVGTGPFMFKEYKPMERVVLVRNENYFRGKPYLERVEIYYMPDESSREFGLEKGELEVIEGPPEQPWLEKMRAIPGVVVDVFGPDDTVVLHINMAKDPFTNLKVRQAVAYCLSRDELTAVIGPDISAPLYSPVPLYMPGGLTREEVEAKGLAYDVDRAKARALLAEAGYPNGFSIEVVITERGEYHIPMVNIQSQLRECGIDVNLKVVDHSSFHTLIRQDVNPLVLYVCTRPNADVFLTRFYHSASIVVTGAKPDTNFSHISSIDGLIEAARAELDPAKQVALWKEAQFKILEEMAAKPLYTKRFIYARKPYVDYGYELLASLAYTPAINELTKILKH
jgi:peptide/nickel transport system substrate-binding protein